jgi:hypothetical protein
MSTKSVTSIESETNTKAATVLPMPPLPQAVSKLIQQYGCGPVQFFGTDSALYERHLIFNNVVDLTACDARIRPLQDLLNLGSHARMNMPGRLTITGAGASLKTYCPSMGSTGWES